MATVSRVPLQTVVLARETKEKDDKGKPISKRVVPTIGEAFDFTEEEVENLDEVAPGALRPPVNESNKKTTKAALTDAYNKLKDLQGADAAKKVVKDTTGVTALKDVDATDYEKLTEALDAARPEESI